MVADDAVLAALSTGSGVVGDHVVGDVGFGAINELRSHVHAAVQRGQLPLSVVRPLPSQFSSISGLLSHGHCVLAIVALA